MKDYKLIQGTISDQEAKDILKNFFESKIHFHEMRNFSSEERLKAIIMLQILMNRKLIILIRSMSFFIRQIWCF